MAEKQVMESRKVKMGTAAVIFNVIGYILVGLVALICLSVSYTHLPAHQTAAKLV